MSHYHLEVIMPPTTDIQAALPQILKPFDENEEESSYPFWDWYVIGGRWAGEKDSCRWDADKLEQFYKRLNEEKVTVSSFVAGKQALQPASQIPKVDGIWNEFFPTETGEITPCPIFAHSNNQYDSDDLLACDICRFDEIPENLTCGRLIVAGPTYSGEGLAATYMITSDMWNGVNHMPVDWDGKVLSGVARALERTATYKQEYRDRHEPKPNWICVTVDYHS